jgi:crotonobetainyl-CoA:carnitine CoA-transferase CaiB-like acyl-CoA transferase
MGRKHDPNIFLAMATTITPTTASKPLLPLKGVRILSLALNLPGPAALMRCKQMGATCVKLEPPAHPSAPKGTPGDPMGLYNRSAYDTLQAGMRIANVDLKSEKGQKTLHRELAKADVLLTSFRPSAMQKLGLDWKTLHRLYPTLSLIAIFGAPGERAEEPGHDLTYLAENDLVGGLELPPTLYADMGGSLMVSEAILKARLHQLQKGKGVRFDIALSDAAAYLALPRTWGLTKTGAAVGGGHAGYRVYPCKDGRVAVAALEPHFAAALGQAVGLKVANIMAMFAPQTHAAIASFLLTQTRKQLDQLAADKDIPLLTMGVA